MLLVRFFPCADVKNSSSVAKDAAKRLTQLAQDDNGEYKAADMSLALDQVNTILEPLPPLSVLLLGFHS